MWIQPCVHPNPVLILSRSPCIIWQSPGIRNCPAVSMEDWFQDPSGCQTLRSLESWHKMAQWSPVYVYILHQSCPFLCDPRDCIPSCFPVHGVLQARILQWVAMPSSRGSFWPSDWTWVTFSEGRFFTTWATREALSPQYLSIGWASVDSTTHGLCSIFTTCGWLNLPGGSDGKEYAWNVGDLGSTPGLGRSPGEGNGYPLQ